MKFLSEQYTDVSLHWRVKINELSYLINVSYRNGLEFHVLEWEIFFGNFSQMKGEVLIWKKENIPHVYMVLATVVRAMNMRKEEYY